jgi:hypothetical protein
MSFKLLEANCSICSKQMKEFKVIQPHKGTLLHWKSALNLMGLSENTTLLQGKVLLDPEEFNRCHDPLLVVTMQAQQSRLCVLFGEHEKGADLSITSSYDWPNLAQAISISRQHCSVEECLRLKWPGKPRSRSSRKTRRSYIRPSSPGLKKAIQM